MKIDPNLRSACLNYSYSVLVRIQGACTSSHRADCEFLAAVSASRAGWGQVVRGRWRGVERGAGGGGGGGGGGNAAKVRGLPKSSI